MNEPKLNPRAGKELRIVYRNWRGEIRDFAMNDILRIG